MDAFAVSLAVGSTRQEIRPRPLFRLSFHFGLFQFLMPVVGWFVGSRVDQYVQSVDHWIAFGLLGYIGVRMIRESRASDDDDKQKSDATKGWTLVGLSVATSIDALAVGLSMGLLGIDVWFPSMIIGLAAAGMTAFGMLFGKKLGQQFGHKMELVGGIILIGIGLKILVEHLV
jgi:putative Mn2+ efflux pump MntP